jgi:hypothetical protein
VRETPNQVHVSGLNAPQQFMNWEFHISAFFALLAFELQISPKVQRIGTHRLTAP